MLIFRQVIAGECISEHEGFQVLEQNSVLVYFTGSAYVMDECQSLVAFSGNLAKIVLTSLPSGQVECRHEHTVNMPSLHSAGVLLVTLAVVLASVVWVKTTNARVKVHTDLEPKLAGSPLETPGPIAASVCRNLNLSGLTVIPL